MTIKSKLMAAGAPGLLAQQIAGTFANSLTAAGSTQGTAYQMTTDDIQIFTTVAASTGAIFMPGTGSAPSPYSAGDEVQITNHGANTLSVYPATGGKIANGSANAAFSVPANKTAFFISLDGLSWAASVSN